MPFCLVAGAGFEPAIPRTRDYEPDSPQYLRSGSKPPIEEKVREARPLLAEYIEAPYPVLANGVLLLCFSDKDLLACETLSRPNNFKFLQQLGLELGIAKVLPVLLKRILEAASKSPEENS